MLLPQIQLELWEIGAALCVCLICGYVVFRYIRSLKERLIVYDAIIDENVSFADFSALGEVAHVSNAFCRMTGYTAAELRGVALEALWFVSSPPETFGDAWGSLTTGHSWQGEVEGRKKDGSPYWVELRLFPKHSALQGQGFSAVMREVTFKRRIEELSIKDDLTGLFNRRHFNAVFLAEHSRVRREDNYFVYLLLDVDFFKKYNEANGHKLGDAVLVSIGSLLQQQLKRAGDFCFRLGGEEFGCLFSAGNPQDAFAFAERIRAAVEALAIEHPSNAPAKVITASIGMTVCGPRRSVSKEHVCRLTDMALAQAKKEGRNRVCTNTEA